MKRIISAILSVIMMLLPMSSLGATGHINGCTNTDFTTNCCTKTFVIIAKSGYEVLDVLVNGVSKGAITSYTFTDITGPQSLKVITRSTGGGTGGDSGGTGGGTLPEGQFRVKFNANGGTGSMPSQIFEDGTTQNLNLNTYTRFGYTFMGWSLTAEGEVEFTDGIVFSATEETTLYAVWELNVYTITYNLNGGTVSGNPATYTELDGDITLINPTLTDFTFLGWTGSNGEAASTTVTIPSGSSGNRTYTANWERSTYTVINSSGSYGKFNGTTLSYGTHHLEPGTVITGINLTGRGGITLQSGKYILDQDVQVWYDQQEEEWAGQTNTYTYTYVAPRDYDPYE